MYERDYILRLIEAFAKMLAAIVGLREKGELDKARTERQHDPHPDEQQQHGRPPYQVIHGGIEAHQEVRHGVTPVESALPEN